MEPILIHTSQRSARLDYVLHWLFDEQLNIPWALTTNPEEAAAAPYCISYGQGGSGITMPNAGLLFEQGIRPIAVQGAFRNGLYTLFPVDPSANTVSFDLFSAIFFLLTRYEEHTETAKDKHGRYPSTQSILHQDGVLERPIVDEWVQYFRTLLAEQWQLELPRKSFTFLPTYDIDIAWSYRHKGLKRTLGAAFRDLVKGNAGAVAARGQVLAGRKPDPFDAYEWMGRLHRKYQLSPRYFILAALKLSPFDKNIHPLHPAMQELIHALQQEGPVGMHPSYFTDSSAAVFLKEQSVLMQITGQPVVASRQHFIRMFLPATYRALLAAGIKDDYSMGYGTALGFRAGTGQSFSWYDLEKEEVTPLRIHPFCFMDTTAHYDLGLDRASAFSRLRQMKDRLEACGSVLTTVFHNFSLGTEPEWGGWRESYEQFILALKS